MTDEDYAVRPCPTVVVDHVPVCSHLHALEALDILLLKCSEAIAIPNGKQLKRLSLERRD